jgi:hypothetical protein
MTALSGHLPPKLKFKVGESVGFISYGRSILNPDIH